MDVTDAISVVSISDVGLIRTCNEDVVASDLTNGLVILADGMGGHQCGEIASAIAVLIITTEVATLLANQQAVVQARTIPKLLKQAVKLANKTIEHTAQAYADCAGMGTTLVSGIFCDNSIVVGHVGDSRMYRLRNNDFLQLTEDHSLIQEQINAGLLAKKEARYASNGHLVTRALGTNANVEPTLHTYQVNVGDIYLLCSDGLTDLVEDDEIKSTIINASGDMNLAVNNLLALAKAYGGTDNVSMLIATVEKPFPI
jgi:PPM family protein phosphatase